MKVGFTLSKVVTFIIIDAFFIQRHCFHHLFLFQFCQFWTRQFIVVLSACVCSHSWWLNISTRGDRNLTITTIFPLLCMFDLILIEKLQIMLIIGSMRIKWFCSKPKSFNRGASQNQYNSLLDHLSYSLLLSDSNFSIAAFLMCFSFSLLFFEIQFEATVFSHNCRPASWMPNVALNAIELNFQQVFFLLLFWQQNLLQNATPVFLFSSHLYRHLLSR